MRGEVALRAEIQFRRAIIVNISQTGAPKTILHIGPPKTGTTTVQEKVLANLTSVCFLGKPWWNPDVPYDKCVDLHRAIDSVTKSDLASYDEAFAKSAVDAWLEHAPAAQMQEDGTYLPRLLSEERLCITDNIDYREIARRLAALFPNAEVVYTRRDPVGGLKSSHRWLYARAWTDLSFSDWLDQVLFNPTYDHKDVAVRYYDWRMIEDCFHSEFNTVRAAEFSLLRKDSAAYLRQLLGADLPELDSLGNSANTPLNVAQNRAVSELHRATKKSIRLWNRLPFSKIDEKPEYLGDTPFWNALEKPLRRIPWGNGKLSVTDADRQKITQYYAGRSSLKDEN